MTSPSERSVNTSDAAPGDVMLQLTHPHSNLSDERVAELVITDRMSGQRLITVRMNSSQFLDLMSSTGVIVGGAKLPAHPERIGKRAQNVSTNLSPASRRTPEQVRDAYLADGWEQVRIDKTNFGHRVVAYRWIEDKPAEEA